MNALSEHEQEISQKALESFLCARNTSAKVVGSTPVQTDSSVWKVLLCMLNESWVTYSPVFTIKMTVSALLFSAYLPCPWSHDSRVNCTVTFPNVSLSL